MSSDKKSLEDSRMREAIKRLYQTRLQLLKKAQEYSQQDDIARAVKHYSEYLNVLAQYFEIDENNLSPDLFDHQKDLAELLLISHVYWDLAKAYDRSPRLQGESARCLNQFVKFSVGFKFQYINAQMLKKYIKKKVAYNSLAFEDAYKKVNLESKGCFISSLCFGIDDPITNNFRSIKPKIRKFYLGEAFVRSYYSFSPSLIYHLSKYPGVEKFTIRYIFRPILKFIHKVIF